MNKKSMIGAIVRSIHDDNGKNLLILSNEYKDQNVRLSKLLLSLGCDPDEKCLMGYSWNDVQRWEGKKCANK